MKMTSMLGRKDFSRAFALSTIVATFAIACGGGEDEKRTLDNGGGSTTGTGSVSGTGSLGTGTGSVLLPGSGGGDGSGGREAVCDAMGNCTCINVAVFGQQGNYGAVPGMDGTSAIQAWLNENSSADVQLFHDKPAINAEFLAQFDVIILEDPRATKDGPKWVYGADEIAAVEAWVRGGPRGIIALSGYSADQGEVDPTNQLLAFTGMQYVGSSDTLGSASGSCAYCLGNSVSETGWNTAHPIAKNITAVGAFHGRSINITGQGVETISTDGATVLGAVAQVDQGRVFMFHDEWVTYTSQWDGTGLQNDCRALDANHMCLNVHPSTTYQTSTFWYNSLRWVSGEPQCFDINDETIIK